MLGGEVQGFVKENRQHSGLRVVGEALEKLGDVGYPEGRLEATPNLSQAILQGKWQIQWPASAVFIGTAPIL